MNNILIRNDKIDNVEQWYWLEEDEGAWDGPRLDWINSHKSTYFNHVKKFDLVVQAGGCLGMYPRLMSDIFKEVYTFEPELKNFEVLKMNCNRDNIHAYNIALGDGCDTLTLYRRYNNNVGMHTLLGGPNLSEFQGGTVEVEVVPLDDFDLPACDMICLDVEGYEARIVLGAMNTIDKFRPVITCENGNDTILRLIEQFGYQAVDKSVSDTIYAVLSND